MHWGVQYNILLGGESCITNILLSSERVNVYILVIFVIFTGYVGYNITIVKILLKYVNWPKFHRNKS